MSRKKLAAGNWKMNMLPSECGKFIKELAEKAKDASNDILVCPTAVCLPAAIEAAKGTNIMVGAQNMYFEEKGAFTGEISPNMLTDLGVTHVIIGHSERREYFAETDDIVNKKVLCAIAHKLTPVVCCGETLEQRKSGITIDFIRTQLKTPVQANEVCSAIRALLCELYGCDTAEKITILYGGSCNAKNAAELFACSDIDGGLVGGASLKTDDFTVIANA